MTGRAVLFLKKTEGLAPLLLNNVKFDYRIIATKPLNSSIQPDADADMHILIKKCPILGTFVKNTPLTPCRTRT